VEILMRRRVPQLVCGLFGLLLFALFFLTSEQAHAINLLILDDYYQIVFAFAVLVGVGSFIRVNLKAVERREDRPYRIVSLLGLVSMPLLALGWGIGGDSPFQWVFENVQVPMQATVFALLAFYVASASFRGFRARSLPATMLLAAALLMILSRSDIGGWVANEVTPVADWIRYNPAMSARRAILIGIGLGSLTTSLRVILGIERTWLGGEK
jgi:hypothetical protein